METPKHLIQRHLRHLDFVRGAIGGEHAERVAAFFTVTQHDPPMWSMLGPGAAGMLEVHERAVVAMGYRRMLGGDLSSVGPLERAMVSRALNQWLPRLGESGERVKARMAKRGLLAVSHHLISEINSEVFLDLAAHLRNAAFALDDAITRASLQSDKGPAYLASQRLAIRGPLLTLLGQQVHLIPSGWAGLAACWLTVARDFGTSEMLDSTEAYGVLGMDENTGAFDLMAAYEASFT